MNQYSKLNSFGGKTLFYDVPNGSNTIMWKLEFHGNKTNDVFEIKVKEANFIYYKTVSKSLVHGSIYEAIYEAWELLYNHILSKSWVRMANLDKELGREEHIEMVKRYEQ